MNLQHPSPREWRRKTLIVLVTIMLPVGAIAQVGPEPPQAEYHVEVDATEREGEANRALFSWVNYQRFSSEATFASMDAFLDLNPAGTQARTEIMIDLMEPQNDNDDPSEFNWQRFRPGSMYRFIDQNGDLFYEEMLDLGMDPIALLTYNVEWLGRGGHRNAPPTSNAEWAEFAAAVVEAHNGSGEDYEPRLTMIEVWNEPSPNGPYWTGTRQEYFELFRAVAERIHRDYPGVRVGGPAVLSGDGGFMLDFIEEVGDVADFYTMHFYNQDPVLMARRIEDWADYIRDETGRSEPLLNITESDNWELQGPEKIDYLLVRQFELVRRADKIAGFHHFSLPYYAEQSDRNFGLIRPNGRVVQHNYLPYWLFNGYEGTHVATKSFVEEEAVPTERTNREPLPFYATATTADGAVNVVSYATSPLAESMSVEIAVPNPAVPYIVEISQLLPAGSIRSRADEIAADEKGVIRLLVDLRRGRAVRIEATPVVE